MCTIQIFISSYPGSKFDHFNNIIWAKWPQMRRIICDVHMGTLFTASPHQGQALGLAHRWHLINPFINGFVTLSTSHLCVELRFKKYICTLELWFFFFRLRKLWTHSLGGKISVIPSHIKVVLLKPGYFLPFIYVLIDLKYDPF